MCKNLDVENMVNFWSVVNFAKFKRRQSFSPYGKLIIYYTINPYMYFHNYLTFMFCSMYTHMHARTHARTHMHAHAHTHTHVYRYDWIYGTVINSLQS